MITSLTEEQASQQYVYRDISMGVGLKTGPTNREAVIPVFKELYTKILNLDPPKYFFFVESPVAAQKLINYIIDVDDVGAQEYKTWTLEKNDELVAKFLSNDIKCSKFYGTHSYGYGSNESYWIWYYKYMKEELGVSYETLADDGLGLFEKLALNSGWHYLADDTVFICDRPESIVMENGVLHNEEGPAVRFTDGREIYAIGGHKVTKQIVMEPRTITVEQISTEENEETKRIMIERFGVSEYLTQTKARIIDRDQLSLEGSAPRILIEDDQGFRWLCCSDGSTGRMYILSASKEADTCKEAHEGMCGFSEDDILAEG